MKNYLILAVKYLQKQKKATIMTICSMIIGIFLICTSLIVIDTVRRGLKEDIIMNGNYDIKYTVNTEEKVNGIINHENIAHSCIVANEEYTYVKNNKTMNYVDNYDEIAEYDLWVNICFFKEANQRIFTIKMLEGNEPEKDGDIVIAKSLNKHLSEPKKIGDTITFGDKDYKICGIFDDKSSSCGYLENDFTQIYAVDSSKCDVKDEKYVDIYTQLKDHKDMILKALVMKDEMKVEVTDYRVNIDMDEFVYYQSGSTLMFVLIIFAALLLIVYVAMVIIRNMFSINVTERIKDYAILKGIGADNGHLCKLFVVESALEGIISMILGMSLAYYMCYKAFDNMITSQNLSQFYAVKISGIVIAGAVIIVAITLFLAAIEPFIIMKKISVTQGINQNYAITNQKIKKVNSGLFRIFGIEGEYAYKNARRNPKAFFTVVTSFVIAIVVYIAFEGFVASYFSNLLIDNDEYYDAEIDIDIDNMTESQREEMRKKLETSELFDEIGDYKNILIPVYDEDLVNEKGELCTIAHLSIYNKHEIDLLKQYITDGAEVYDKLSKEGAVVIVQDSENNMYDIQVSDTINIVTDKDYYNEAVNKSIFSLLDKGVELCEKYDVEFEGIKETGYLFAKEFDFKEISVASIASKSLYTEFEGAIIDVIMTQEYFDSVAGKNVFDGYNNKFNVRVNEDADMETIDNLIYNMEETYIMFYNEEWAEYQFIKAVRKKLNYLILGLGAIGIFYMVNSLASEQLRRKHEMGILRAVGMDKSQMIKMILLEKGIMCMIAYVTGVLLGNAIFYVWVKQLERVDEGLKYVVPFDKMLIVLAVMLVVTVISSIIPIMTMKKMNINSTVHG